MANKRNDRRHIRRAEAERRAEDRTSRGDDEQRKLIDSRPGDSMRERSRL